MEGEVRVDNANERVDPLEDLVDGTVATSSIPPTFNHSLVVTVDGEVPSSMARVVELVSKPTASAHPMSHCLCKVCHPLMSLQALHLPRTMIVILKPELTSENMKQLDRGGNGSAEGGPAQEGKPPGEMHLLAD